MKKFALVFFSAICLSVVGLTGCGKESNTVIETPPVTEPEMTPEEQAAYDKAMEESMSEPGN